MTSDVSSAAVELIGIHKGFHGQSVLQGLDLRVETGQTFTILGGSGTGKSVCLKLMIGLLSPEQGRVSCFGRDVTELSEAEWVAIRKDFGMVFQGAALFDSLDVFENVAYPLREHLDLGEAQLAERVASCLEAVGLPGLEGKLPSELSGGMRKRVGVARAIALEPRAILYDEPTTGLDPANQRLIGELIGELQTRLQVTSVVVTHELELCFSVSDRVALLKRGVIAAEGSVAAMRESDHPDVQAFLKGVRDEGPVVWDGPPGGGSHGS